MPEVLVGGPLLAEEAFGEQAVQDAARGEGVAILVLVVVLASWMSSDERRGRALDRAADRSGDAELTAYNARLRAMAEQSR